MRFASHFPWSVHFLTAHFSSNVHHTLFVVFTSARTGVSFQSSSCSVPCLSPVFDMSIYPRAPIPPPRSQRRLQSIPNTTRRSGVLGAADPEGRDRYAKALGGHAMQREGLVTRRAAARRRKAKVRRPDSVSLIYGIRG